MRSAVRNLVVPAAVFATVGFSLVAVAELGRHHTSPRPTQVAAPRASAAPAASGAAGTPTKYDADVEAAVKQAVLTHQTVTVPVRQAAGPQAAVTADDLTRESTQGRTAVQGIFAPAPAAKEVAALDKSIAMQRGGHFKVRGAGVKNFVFAKVQVDPTALTATVKTSVEAWSQISMMNPDGTWHDAEPHNVLLVTATLARDATGKWMVQTFDWTFAPGSEP